VGSASRWYLPVSQPHASGDHGPQTGFRIHAGWHDLGLDLPHQQAVLRLEGHERCEAVGTRYVVQHLRFAVPFRPSPRIKHASGQNLVVTYCGNCGHEVSGEFCGQCGQHVALADKQVDKTRDVTATDPVAPTPRGRPAEGGGQGTIGLTPPTVPERLWTAVTEDTGPDLSIGPLPPRGTLPLAALAVAGVVLLAALGIVGWRLHWFGDAEHAAAPATSSVTMPVTPTDPPGSEDTSTESAQTPATTAAKTRTKSATELGDDAYSLLEQTVSRDAQLDPIRGQWVAQLASKTEGIVDTSQQATPFTLPDILKEIQSLQANPEFGSSVRVVHQGDWAKSKAGPTPMWVAFADINESSRASVVSWCQAHFAQRGAALRNVCYPRQMSPK